MCTIDRREVVSSCWQNVNRKCLQAAERLKSSSSSKQRISNHITETVNECNWHAIIKKRLADVSITCHTTCPRCRVELHVSCFAFRNGDVLSNIRKTTIWVEKQHVLSGGDLRQLQRLSSVSYCKGTVCNDLCNLLTQINVFDHK